MIDFLLDLLDRFEEPQPLQPADFPESNFRLTGEGGIGDLPAWKGQSPRGKNVFISAWEAPSLLQRLRFLLTGRLYLGVRSGFHPPVWIHPEAFQEGGEAEEEGQQEIEERERKIETIERIVTP